MNSRWGSDGPKGRVVVSMRQIDIFCFLATLLRIPRTTAQCGKMWWYELKRFYFQLNTAMLDKRRVELERLLAERETP